MTKVETKKRFLPRRLEQIVLRSFILVFAFISLLPNLCRDCT
jgi:hypothetical protein